MKMDIGKKIAGGVAVIGLIFLVVGVISYENVRMFVKDAELTARAEDVIERIETLVSLVKDIESGGRGYIISGSEGFLEHYNTAMTVLDDKIKELRSLIKDPEQLRRLEELRLLISERVSRIKERVAIRRESGFEAAQAAFDTAGGNALMNDIRKKATEMRDAEGAILNERRERSKQSADIAQLTIILGTCAALLLAIMFALLITRSITRPLRVVVDRITEIAQTTGNLTATIPIASDDEMGDLARSFNKMIVSLKGIILQIVNTSERVSSSSQQLSVSAQEMNATTEELSSTVQQIAKGSEQTAQKTGESSKAMDQMAASVEQVSRNAREAATQASSAYETAQKSGQQAKKAEETMIHIAESVASSVQIVGKLSDRAGQIGEIVGVITDIADQVNLLALNAAIEAARAGEAGRGFAVVAEEVRKLAESATRSTGDIKNIVKSVQKEMADAISSIKSVSQEAVAVKEIAEKVGQSMTSIIKNAEIVTSVAEQVSVATTQMASGTKLAVKSIADIATTSEETASATEQASSSAQELTAAMGEMAASSQELAETAVTLQGLVGKFRFEEEGRTVEKPQVRPAAMPFIEKLHREKEKGNRIPPKRTI